MTSYRDGSVDLTNGSTDVTGAGTAWTAAANVGDLFTQDFKTLYEITAVDSETSLKLDRDFEGATVAGATYAILPVSLRRDLSTDLVRQLADLLTRVTASGLTFDRAGINALASEAVRLAVASDKIRFGHNGGNIEVELDKAATGDTAAFLLKSNGIPRARLGLIGSDVFKVETSADGVTFNPAYSIGSNGKFGAMTTSNKFSIEITPATRSWTPSVTTGLMVERGGHSAVSIIAHPTNVSTLNFGDTDDENAGLINYDHASGTMQLRAGGTGINVQIDRYGTLASLFGMEVRNTAPTCDLYDTNAADGRGRARMSLQSDQFAFQTRIGVANVFVANDYLMMRGDEGAVSHSWRIEGAEKLSVNSAGTVTANDSFAIQSSVGWPGIKPLMVGAVGAANDADGIGIRSFRPHITFNDASTAAADYQWWVDAGRMELRQGDAAVDHRLGTLTFSIDGSGHLTPGTDNTQNLGSSSFRFSELFAGNGTINTSDANLKEVRGGLTNAERAAWARVQPGIFRWLDAIERKGDSARLHAGFIAQDVETAFDDEGLDPWTYGLLCKDEITKPVVVEREVERQVMVTETQERTVIEMREGSAVQVTVTQEVEVPQFETIGVVDEDGDPVLEIVDPAIPGIDAKDAVIDEETGEVIEAAEPGRAPKEAVYRQVTHRVPVMEVETETVTEYQSAGERLGLRYEQCLVFQAAVHAQEISALEARIAALEASVAS